MSSFSRKLTNVIRLELSIVSSSGIRIQVILAFYVCNFIGIWVQTLDE